jgi:hypothetical protein
MPTASLLAGAGGRGIGPQGSLAWRCTSRFPQVEIVSKAELPAGGRLAIKHPGLARRAPPAPGVQGPALGVDRRGVFPATGDLCCHELRDLRWIPHREAWPPAFTPDVASG